MMEALRIIAGSWPIACMVVGLAAAVVVRRTLKQAMDNSQALALDRASGNRAVVVQPRPHADD